MASPKPAPSQHAAPLPSPNLQCQGPPTGKLPQEAARHLAGCQEAFLHPDSPCPSSSALLQPVLRPSRWVVRPLHPGPGKQEGEGLGAGAAPLLTAEGQAVGPVEGVAQEEGEGHCGLLAVAPEVQGAAQGGLEVVPGAVEGPLLEGQPVGLQQEKQREKDGSPQLWQPCPLPKSWKQTGNPTPVHPRPTHTPAPRTLFPKKSLLLPRAQWGRGTTGSFFGPSEQLPPCPDAGFSPPPCRTAVLGLSGGGPLR